MTKQEAIQAIESGETELVHFGARDATGKSFTHHTCWIEEDVGLVYASLDGAAVPAPDGVIYHIGGANDPERIAREEAIYQADRDAEIDRLQAGGLL